MEFGDNLEPEAESEKEMNDFEKMKQDLDDKGVDYNMVERDGKVGIMTKEGGAKEAWKVFGDHLQENMLPDLMETAGMMGVSSYYTDKISDSLGSSKKDLGLSKEDMGEVSQAIVTIGNNQNMQPGQDQWYKDDDMQKALKSENEGNDSQIFGCVPAKQGDLVENSIKTAKAMAENGETALMPFNLDDNHWVGGAMTKINDEVCFIHNDPLGNSIDYSLNNELTAQGISVIDLKQRQQDDTNSCGPFTVDNLGKFAQAAEDLKDPDLNLSKEDIESNLKDGLEKGPDAAASLRENQDTTQNDQTQPSRENSGGAGR